MSEFTTDQARGVNPRTASRQPEPNRVGGGSQPVRRRPRSGDAAPGAATGEGRRPPRARAAGEEDHRSGGPSAWGRCLPGPHRGAEPDGTVVTASLLRDDVVV